MLIQWWMGYSKPELLSSSDPHPDTPFRHSIWHTISKYIWHVYIFFGILSDILPGICSDILSDNLSGIYSGILSGIYSDILSGIYSGILSGIYSGILSGIYSDILLAPILASFLTFDQASILTFYLASILTFYLASILASNILAFYLASTLTFFLASILAFYLASFQAFFLAFYLAPIPTFFLASILNKWLLFISQGFLQKEPQQTQSVQTFILDEDSSCLMQYLQETLVKRARSICLGDSKQFNIEQMGYIISYPPTFSTWWNHMLLHVSSFFTGSDPDSMIVGFDCTDSMFSGETAICWWTLMNVPYFVVAEIPFWLVNPPFFLLKLSIFQLCFVLKLRFLLGKTLIFLTYSPMFVS